MLGRAPLSALVMACISACMLKQSCWWVCLLLHVLLLLLSKDGLASLMDGTRETVWCAVSGPEKPVRMWLWPAARILPPLIMTAPWR